MSNYLFMSNISLKLCVCVSTQTGRITLSQLGEVLRTMDIDVESDEDVRSLLVGIGKCM